jgi:hypothetical protein
MLPESVGPFGAMQGSEEQVRRTLHAMPGVWGVDVGKVQGDYEAGIDVNANNVPGPQG